MHKDSMEPGLYCGMQALDDMLESLLEICAPISSEIVRGCHMSLQSGEGDMITCAGPLPRT